MYSLAPHTAIDFYLLPYFLNSRDFVKSIEIVHIKSYKARKNELYVYPPQNLKHDEGRRPFLCSAKLLLVQNSVVYISIYTVWTTKSVIPCALDAN